MELLSRQSNRICSRSEAYALQNNLSLPHVLFAITPDDDSSCMVELLSRKSNIRSIPVEEQMDNVLKEVTKQRTAIRLKVPGRCAFYYDVVADIVD